MPTVNSVMLAIHCKRTDQVDVVTPVTKYIKSVYSEREATEAAEDLTRISSLRSEIANAASVCVGSQVTLKETLLKYYTSLLPVETRFPISRDKTTVQISFPWYDAFRPQKKTSQYNIHFEKAAVLFNIGAACSQQGLAADRTAADGLKAACQAFQEAAGAFQMLKDVASRIDNPRPTDLSAECITMLEKLMLAQAQECAYNSAVMGGKTPAVLARLSKQAAIMYDEVQGLFVVPTLQQHFDRSWVAHLAMKSSLYEVEALMQVGRGLHAQDKMAHEIATLTEAFKLIQSTKKQAKAMGKDLEDSVRQLQDTLQAALARAERDNASIYLERVPAFADLPAVQGALLVKATPPLQNLDGSAEKLFTGLVPDHSAKALSKYSDMVDGVVRQQLNALEAATDTARLRLREWELPETLQALEARSTTALPDSLVAELAEVASMGGLSHLKGILVEIGEIRRAVEGDLAQCEGVLTDEARADEGARSRWGDKWTVPPSGPLAKNFWDKLASYRATLKQAGDSDGSIIQRMNEREAAFAALTPEMAVQQMPKLQAPLVAMGPHDPAVVVANLRRNLEALQQVAAERGAIEEALKEAKQKDNVLPKLMACPNPDALFTAEIKKYDPLAADAAKNCARNDELLAAIGQDNQRFRAIFEVPAWRAACESAAGGVRSQLRALKELLDHLSEGLRFYLSLQETVKTHHQLCSDFACTRTIQRDELTQELEKKRKEEMDRESQRLAALHVQAQQAHGPPPGAYPQPPPSNVYSYPSQAPNQPPPPHYGYQQQPPAGPPAPYAAAPGYNPQQPYPPPAYQSTPYGNQAPPPQQQPPYQQPPPGQYPGYQHPQQQYNQYQQPPPQQAPPPPQQQQSSGYNPYQPAPPPHAPPHATQYDLNPYGAPPPPYGR